MIPESKINEVLFNALINQMVNAAIGSKFAYYVSGKLVIFSKIEEDKFGIHGN